LAGIAAGLREDRAQRGILMMLAAYLGFSCIDTSAKWLVLLGLPALQIAFFRYFGHFAISLGSVLIGGSGRDRFGTDALGLVLIRAICLMLSTVANFIALKFLPLTVTASILFSAPLIVTALSGPVLGERVGPWRWGSVVLGFAGVLVVMRPFGEAFHPATLVSLSGATCFAVYALLTRKLSGRVAAETMQLYSGAVGTLVLLPLAIIGWQTPPSAASWLVMLVIGLWGWGGHELFSRAHRFAEASVLMPFTYVFLIYLTVAGYLAFGDVPDAPTLVGAAIIVTSGLIVWWRERRAEIRPVLPPKSGF
jgi:drug/metabolite transporter (DMT)-like permease